ncbi:MAG TPA: TonB family protein [Cytophagales bacterium]|jgi:TonB family protein
MLRPSQTTRTVQWRATLTALLVALLPLVHGCRSTEPLEPQSTADSGILVIGTVSHPLNDKRIPLAGARVVVKGTNTGTTTDQAGAYRLENVAPGSTLVFTAEGRGTREFTVGPAGRGRGGALALDVQFIPGDGGTSPGGEKTAAAPLAGPPPGAIYMVVEHMPEFVGGMEGLVKYMGDNLVYPKEAAANKVTGTVFVSFIINTDGSVSDVQVLRGIGSGCNEEALRVVQHMPAWLPGKQSGQPVAVRYSLPIRFVPQ